MADEPQVPTTSSDGVGETGVEKKTKAKKRDKAKKAQEGKAKEDKTRENKAKEEKTRQEERTKFRQEVRDLIDTAQGRLRLFNEYGVFQSSDKNKSDAWIDARDAVVAKLAEARASLADDKLEAAHDAALEADLALEDTLYSPGFWRGIKRGVIRYQPFLLLWYFVVLGIFLGLSLAAGGDGDWRDVRLWRAPADSQVVDSANGSPSVEGADGGGLNQAEELAASETADSLPEVPAEESPDEEPPPADGPTERQESGPSGEAPTETEAPGDDLAEENLTDGRVDVPDDAEDTPNETTGEADRSSQAAADDGSSGPADSPSGSGIPLAVLLAGGLGAVLRGLWWLWLKVSRWELRINYRLAHLCAPVIGLLLGLFAYLAVTGGLMILEGIVTGTVDVSTDPSAGMLLVCFFAGYNWEVFLEWINRLMNRRFANGEDNGSGK